MREPSSSSHYREERRRSHPSHPYGDRYNLSSREGGSLLRRDTPEQKSRHRGTRSPIMTSSASDGRAPEGEDKELKQMPWMELLQKDVHYNGAEHRLHHEILAYLKYMEQTPGETKVREKVMAGIRRAVYGRFNGAEISLYGSSATGLCLPTSDLDVALLIPRVSEADVKKKLFILSSLFKSNPMTQSVFVNHRAHVPILMLETREEYGSLGVDININNNTGAQGASVIKGYLAKMPALKPLVLLLKMYLRQRRLNDASKGGLGSYALVCMIIHFLQMNPSKRPQEYIENPIEAESLGFLLTDFMFYYGLTFSYKTTYISPAASPGTVLPKAEQSELLSVRCLMDHEKEVAKSVMKPDLLLQTFKDAYATLLQTNFADKEMLGQIIRVDKNFIKQRARFAGPVTPDAPRRRPPDFPSDFPPLPSKPHPSLPSKPHHSKSHPSLPSRPAAIQQIPRNGNMDVSHALRSWRDRPVSPIHGGGGGGTPKLK